MQHVCVTATTEESVCVCVCEKPSGVAVLCSAASSAKAGVKEET